MGFVIALKNFQSVICLNFQSFVIVRASSTQALHQELNDKDFPKEELNDALNVPLFEHQQLLPYFV